MTVPLFNSGFECEDLLAIDIHNFTAFIVAAVWANVMGQAHITAVRARNQLASLEGVVCPAAVPSAFGNLSFWQRGHNFLLITNYSSKIPTFRQAVQL